MITHSSFGLTSREARRRQHIYGKNLLTDSHPVKPLKILIQQFSSPLILILLAAALMAGGLTFLPEQNNSLLDSLLIFIIVIISGIAGFIQEYKSEKTIQALQKLTIPRTRVMRDGVKKEISSADLVPGDLIFLTSGDIIPADAIIKQSFNLSLNEAVLTGESEPVAKKSGDKIFMNTYIENGSGQAVVLKTGMNTKVGQIASQLQKINEEKSVFESEINKFSRKISIAIIIIILVIMLIGLFKYSFYTSLLTAISLAVAAVPEGLAAVVVLTLAVAAKSLFRQHSLIRKLSVTETLGAVDIICTDKTGTLTKNEMAVTKIFSHQQLFDFSKINKKDRMEAKTLLYPLISCAGLCNNAILGYDAKQTKKYFGDQTDIALKKFADQLGLNQPYLDQYYTRLDEFSFSAKRKMMSVICQTKSSQAKKEKIIYSKGAPEILLQKCRFIYSQGRKMPLTQEMQKAILKQNKKFAEQGLRVLGFAFKEILPTQKSTPTSLEQNLTWLGLAALTDPPRPEVKQALQRCQRAGVRVIMLTGDNPITAQSIAQNIGLASSQTLTSLELKKMSDNQLTHQLHTGTNIFARVSPFDKLRILKLLKDKHNVAMTGDGVNDALALKQAQVGIAMGVRGTEVAKQASDMILLDDNFSSITLAIQEGRRIFDNIRKFINYLFVCNLAEVGVIFIATLLVPLKEPILFPVQLLWINLLTDGLPALALGVDPARPDIMKHPPRKKGEPLINKRLAWLIGLIGIKKTLILLASFLIALPLGVSRARSILFTGFIFYELVRIASIRYQEKLTWLSNYWLVGALAGSIMLQIIIIYSPLNHLFYLQPFGLVGWTILLAGTLLGYFLAILLTKLVLKFIPE